MGRCELSDSHCKNFAHFCCWCVCVCGVGVKLTPGQLVVASLMERGHSVRAIIRNPEKGKALFGDQDPQQFQVSPLDQQLFT